MQNVNFYGNGIHFSSPHKIFSIFVSFHENLHFAQENLPKSHGHCPIDSVMEFSRFKSSPCKRVKLMDRAQIGK